MVRMDKTKKHRLAKILGYSAGDFLGGGVGQVTSLYYLTFLMYVAGLSPLQAGLVAGIGKIWDAITDPLMGVIVDRTRSKFGACRFWMLISVVPIFITYFMLWYSFGIQGTTAKFIYYVFAYMLYSTALTVGLIPYEALLPRIVSDYRERTSYSSMRMIFSGVACVLSTYIYEWLIPVSETNPLSPAFSDHFMILGIVLGIMFSLPMLVTFFGTKESAMPSNIRRLTLKSIINDYKEVLKVKIYRKYYILYLLGTFISAAVNASMVIFVYIIFGNISNFLLTFSLVFLVINLKGAIEIVFFVPNVLMMRKFNKHRPYLIDIPLIIAASAIIFFITPASPIWLYLVAVGILGAGVSCLNFVPMTLLPDLSDVDEMMYGKRREGVNAGLSTLGRKVVYGLSIMLFGAILSAFGVSSESADPSAATPSAILAIKIMFAAIPFICSLFILVISRTYNLDEKSHKMIKRLIEEKRAGQTLSATEEERRLLEQISGAPFDTLWIASDK